MIYDISLTITPHLPVWPGDPPVILERVSKIEDGANANVSQIGMSAHTGTHVDAPYHFLGDSQVTVELLPLEVLTGRALVIHLPDQVDVITARILQAIETPAQKERILFKTRNSHYWSSGVPGFQTGFVGLDAGAAEVLVSWGVRLVGVDYLSVAPYKHSRPTHEILLKAGMIILEGLDLSQVPAGEYQLCCLPLKLGGADGAPARAVLFKE